MYVNRILIIMILLFSSMGLCLTFSSQTTTNSVLQDHLDSRQEFAIVPSIFEMKLSELSKNNYLVFHLTIQKYSKFLYLLESAE